MYSVVCYQLSVIWRNAAIFKLVLHYPGSLKLVSWLVIRWLVIFVVCCQLSGEILEISNYHYIILIPCTLFFFLLPVVKLSVEMMLISNQHYIILAPGSWFLALIEISLLTN